MDGTLKAPELLTTEYDLSSFDCGEAVLDDWLRRHALKNQSTGAARTYVVAEADGQVVGYYALATGAVNAREAPGRVRRNMPDPVPVMVLGRLAVDRSWQGRGLGRALLQDALHRTLQAAEIAGIRAMLVHALHDQAAAFYRNAGFLPSPLHGHTLMRLLQDVRAAMDDQTERG